jgi:hypothetical protein
MQHHPMAESSDTGGPVVEEEGETGSGSAAEASTQNDPCTPGEDLGKSWIDWINRKVDSAVCQSSMWFDGFFGDDRADEIYGTTGGRVSTHLYWTEYDDFDPKLRFRAHYVLPNLDNKVDAFVGRETRDEYLTDTRDPSDPGNPFFGLDDEEELLVGLGYSPDRRPDRRLRFSVGANLRWPPEPYAKVNYRRIFELDQLSLLRWRQTVFWELEDQLGTTTNLDLERRLGASFLLRWAINGTISGITDGIDWWTNLTLYQSLSSRRALAYTVWSTGETLAEVPLNETGIRVVYRQRIARDWLFVDVGPSVSWPRWVPEDLREPSWGAVIGAEMLFGSWR